MVAEKDPTPEFDIPLPQPESFGQKCMRVFGERRKVTGIATSEACAAVIDELLAELPVKTPKKTKAPEEKPVRPRNLLVDGIMEACNEDPIHATKPALRAAGTAIGAIKEVCPDVTPEEIHRRAKLYRQKHTLWTLSPTALAKWWHESEPPAQENRVRDVYTAPDNWKTLARAKWGNIELPGAWLDLAITLRADLLRTHA